MLFNSVTANQMLTANFRNANAASSSYMAVHKSCVRHSESQWEKSLVNKFL